MAIKLDKIKRWLPIREYLKHKWNVYVYFSNRHVNYYSAWLYTTKEDERFLQSPGHPDLINSGPPRTMSASQARAKRRRVEDPATESESGEDEVEVKEREGEEGSASSASGATKSTSRRRRSRCLSSFQVSEIVVSKQIKTKTELLALACKHPKSGRKN